MIQRVQSLYLLCSIIFMAIFASMPYFNIVAPDATYQLTSCGIEVNELADGAATTATVVSSQNYIVLILSILIAVVSIVSILLYKSRPKQILLCKVNILFYITLYVVMGLSAYINYSNLQGTGFTTTTYVVFPICALITNWLAMSAINKDEQLVRDSERMWSRNR